ncbi:MAG: ABC-F family ATP-binding cassette domain-containing protein [Marinifilaceae bacterium]
MISYLQVEDLSKSYGEKVLFENISFGIGKGQKVALIAPNGTGKTSLLNIIANKDSAETGSVIFRNDLRLGYLEQQPKINENNSIIDEIFTADSKELNAIRQYEHMMENDIQEGLDDVLAQMDSLKAWDYEAKIKQILSNLKIENLKQKISTLSGGQKKRVGLAKVIISEPDILILDEPTNHLDLQMIEWLEAFLFKTKSTLLMVTHDRYFLDRVCDHIIEIDDNQIFNYNGNYSYYLRKREERIANKTAEISRAQNLMRTETEWMSRMPQARGTKAKYRVDAYSDLKKIADQRINNDTVQLDIKGSRLGNKILEIDKLSKSFGDLNVLDKFTYKFTRGEKIGIIGKNGVGKSSFLNLITGSLQADSGTIELGETVVYGYYRQDDYDIDESKKMIDVIKDIAETITLGTGNVLSASKFLEYFLFPDKQQYSLVKNLSGGEKRRLYLMTVLMNNPNFLILDEPTNDLDIVTLNVLEEYLKAFNGCVLIVTHDRFFMDKLVDHLFVFEGEGKIRDFHAPYTIYREVQKEEERRLKEAESAAKKAAAPKEHSKPKIENDKPKKLSYKEKTEFDNLEKDMDKLNAEKEEIEAALNTGSLIGDELVEKAKRIAEIMDLLDDKEMRWLELSERV